MGEFLVSKKGIGYLIIYGTQVFKNEYSLKLVFLIEISTAPFNISLTKIKE